MTDKIDSWERTGTLNYFDKLDAILLDQETRLKEAQKHYDDVFMYFLQDDRLVLMHGKVELPVGTEYTAVFTNLKEGNNRRYSCSAFPGEVAYSKVWLAERDDKIAIGLLGGYIAGQIRDAFKKYERIYDKFVVLKKREIYFDL